MAFGSQKQCGPCDVSFSLGSWNSSSELSSLLVNSRHGSSTNLLRSRSDEVEQPDTTAAVVSRIRALSFTVPVDDGGGESVPQSGELAQRLVASRRKADHASADTGMWVAGALLSRMPTPL